MLIYLLRHGETEYNRLHRYQGRRDLSLSPQGRQKLRQSTLRPEKVYCSPMRRAVETAEILFPNSEIVTVSGLEEVDFGIFEGKSYLELQHEPAYVSWLESRCTDPIPKGESKAEFCTRVCDAFCQLMKNREGETMVIVAHGGTQMALMEAYVTPHRDYFQWSAPNGGGYLLDGSSWNTHQTLTLVKELDYRREERQ